MEQEAVATRDVGEVNAAFVLERPCCLRLEARRLPTTQVRDCKGAESCVLKVMIKGEEVKVGRVIGPQRRPAPTQNA